MKQLVELVFKRNCLTAPSLAELKNQAQAALGVQLAILDVNLGHGEPTGLDVFNWLKSNGFKGRIVFLTGHADNDPRVREVSGLHGTEVLSKPISIDDLKEVILKEGSP